jgi:hypothetical protein
MFIVHFVEINCEDVLFVSRGVCLLYSYTVYKSDVSV